jgi:hypothetical protein
MRDWGDHYREKQERKEARKWQNEQQKIKNEQEWHAWEIQLGNKKYVIIPLTILLSAHFKIAI